MKIGIDARALLGGQITGVGVYAQEIIMALLAADDSTEWVLFSNSAKQGAPVTFNHPRVTVCHTRYPNKLLNIIFALGLESVDGLVRRQKKLSIDHWFSPNINFSPLSRAPHTLTIHDATFSAMPSWYTLKQRWWHRLTRATRQVADAKYILTPSENTRRDCIEFLGADPSRVQTILSGVTLPIRQYLAAAKENQESAQRQAREKYLLTNPYILYVGALEPRKNLSAAVAAFEMAAPKLPEKYTFILAGAHGWSNDALFKRLAASPLAGRVRYLGYVPETQKAGLIAGASAFVYPSFYEGFGFPVLDALALSVPVITSPRSALFEVAGQAAFYAHPERPAEIANGLVALLTDKNWRNKKIATGLEQANKFSWAASAAKILKLWRG